MGGRDRWALSILVLTLVVLYLVPAHEYTHCLMSWGLGRLEGNCEVEYSVPFTEDWLGRAAVGDIYWWEHPVMLAVEVVAVLVLVYIITKWAIGKE